MNNLAQLKLHLNGVSRHKLNYQIISKNYEYDQGTNSILGWNTFELHFKLWIKIYLPIDKSL